MATFDPEVEAGTLSRRRTAFSLPLDASIGQTVITQPPQNGKRKLMGFAALAVTLLAMPLSGCNDHAAAPTARTAFVRTEIVQSRGTRVSATLTGEVRARFQADLSFPGCKCGVGLGAPDQDNVMASQIIFGNFKILPNRDGAFERV